MLLVFSRSASVSYSLGKHMLWAFIRRASNTNRQFAPSICDTNFLSGEFDNISIEEISDNLIR